MKTTTNTWNRKTFTATSNDGRKPVLHLDENGHSTDVETLAFTLREWWGIPQTIGIVVWEHGEREADGLYSQNALFSRSIQVRALPDPDRIPEDRHPEIWHEARCERAVQIGRVMLAVERAQAMVN